jgi:hypothetical protein
MVYDYSDQIGALNVSFARGTGWGGTYGVWYRENTDVDIINHTSDYTAAVSIPFRVNSVCSKEPDASFINARVMYDDVMLMEARLYLYTTTYNPDAIPKAKVKTRVQDGALGDEVEMELELGVWYCLNVQFVHDYGSTPEYLVDAWIGGGPSFFDRRSDVSETTTSSSITYSENNIIDVGFNRITTYADCNFDMVEPALDVVSSKFYQILRNQFFGFATSSNRELTDNRSSSSHSEYEITPLIMDDALKGTAFRTLDSDVSDIDIGVSALNDLSAGEVDTAITSNSSIVTVLSDTDDLLNNHSRLYDSSVEPDYDELLTREERINSMKGEEIFLDPGGLSGPYDPGAPPMLIWDSDLEVKESELQIKPMVDI